MGHQVSGPEVEGWGSERKTNVTSVRDTRVCRSSRPWCTLVQGILHGEGRREGEEEEGGSEVKVFSNFI